MPIVELDSQIQPVIEKFKGDNFNQKIAHLLGSGVERYLEECEREYLRLEIKYGLGYDQFKEEVKKGKLGDEFSYELENDLMRWEDLIVEKKHWLEQLKTVRKLFK